MLDLKYKTAINLLHETARCLAALSSNYGYSDPSDHREIRHYSCALRSVSASNGRMGSDCGCDRSSGRHHRRGFTFFIDRVNKPKLVPRAWLTTRKIDDTHIECSVWFTVTNERKNTARRVRAEIRTTSEDGPPRFPTFQRMKWELPDKSTEYQTYIQYKDERKISWFTEVLEIRRSGNELSYYMGESKIVTFLPDGLREFPVVGIVISMIGEEGLDKKFWAILWATPNTQEPLTVILKEGLPGDE